MDTAKAWEPYCGHQDLQVHIRAAAKAPLQSIDKRVLLWKQRSLRLRRKGAGRYGVLDKVSMAVRQHTPPNYGSDNNHSLPQTASVD